RASRYSLSFTEPWFMGRPWTLGFSVFKRSTDYNGFRRDGNGTTVSVGRLLGAFSRFDLAYGLENVKVIPTVAAFNASASESTTSSVTALYTIDTRNNYFRPTHGYRLQTATQFAGGFLGGDNYFYKPRVDATLYLPGFARKHYVGLNASYGYVAPF